MQGSRHRVRRAQGRLSTASRVRRQRTTPGRLPDGGRPVRPHRCSSPRPRDLGRRPAAGRNSARTRRSRVAPSTSSVRASTRAPSTASPSGPQGDRGSPGQTGTATCPDSRGQRQPDHRWHRQLGDLTRLRGIRLCRGEHGQGRDRRSPWTPTAASSPVPRRSSVASYPLSRAALRLRQQGQAGRQRRPGAVRRLLPRRWHHLAGLRSPLRQPPPEELAKTSRPGRQSLIDVLDTAPASEAGLRSGSGLAALLRREPGDRCRDAQATMAVAPTPHRPGRSTRRRTNASSSSASPRPRWYDPDAVVIVVCSSVRPSASSPRSTSSSS